MACGGMPIAEKPHPSIVIVREQDREGLNEVTPLERVARQIQEVGCWKCLDDRSWLVGREMGTEVALGLRDPGATYSSAICQAFHRFHLNLLPILCIWYFCPYFRDEKN